MEVAQKLAAKRDNEFDIKRKKQKPLPPMKRISEI